MNRYEGLTCPVCHQKLFEEDDVAVCPECGAPHHRECYLKEGHCHFEEAHGTPDQWTMPKPPEPEPEPEPEPQAEAPQEENEDPQSAYQTPFLFAQVDPKEDIDGESAGNIIKFVGINAMHYLNAFRRIANGAKVSWNWMAFLFTEYWLFSRKCYKEGFLVSMLNLLLYIPVIAMGIAELADPTAIMQFASSMSFSDMIILFTSSTGMMALRVIMGLLGDHIYKKKVYSGLKLARENGSADDFSLARLGGVNLFAMMIAYFGFEFVLFIVNYFIHYM